MDKLHELNGSPDWVCWEGVNSLGILAVVRLFTAVRQRRMVGAVSHLSLFPGSDFGFLRPLAHWEHFPRNQSSDSTVARPFQAYGLFCPCLGVGLDRAGLDSP